MALFKILKGNEDNLPKTEFHEGYMYITEDKGNIFVDKSDTERIQLSALNASFLLDKAGNQISESAFVYKTGQSDMSGEYIISEENSQSSLILNENNILFKSLESPGSPLVSLSCDSDINTGGTLYMWNMDGKTAVTPGQVSAMATDSIGCILNNYLGLVITRYKDHTILSSNGILFGNKQGNYSIQIQENSELSSINATFELDESGGIILSNNNFLNYVSSVNSSQITVNAESTTAGKYYPIELNADNKLIVNVPWTTYTLPVATASTLGGIKSGTDITIDNSGNVSVNDDSHNHTNYVDLFNFQNIGGTKTFIDGLVIGSNGLLNFKKGENGGTSIVEESTAEDAPLLAFYGNNGDENVSLIGLKDISASGSLDIDTINCIDIESTGNINCEKDITGDRVIGAVWNDYAEYRDQFESIEPGYCVASSNSGKVYKTTEKFQACDGIVSDTFGFAIGETNEAKIPLAVAGRVLAYVAGDRNNYQAGDTVCAGPDGKVVKMTREEIKEYPDRIVGIVSEIPEYETWGSGNVQVNGRIWIKIK